VVGKEIVNCNKKSRINYTCRGCGKEEPSAMATYYVEELGGSVGDLELYCISCCIKSVKEKDDGVRKNKRI
jgi:hypothetical protein